MTPDDERAVQRNALSYLTQFVAVTPVEADSLEVVDFGLDDFGHLGLVILTYVNTDRCCAKELILLEDQVCAEHLHPPFDGHAGKEETFRVRTGTVYLYTEGEPTPSPRCGPRRREHFTAWREIGLEAGEQHTVPPATKHWFQAVGGPALISEFSTQSRDEYDVFTDPAMVRVARGRR